MEHEVLVSDLLASLCKLAPLELQMDFDNSGFQVGRGDAAVRRALLALDVTSEVVEEAKEKQVQLILSHHPLIFSPVRSISDRDPEGKLLLSLIESGLAVISMHTNLDIVSGGVNDALLDVFGLKALCPLDGDGCGRIAELPEAEDFSSFLARCKTVLKAAGLRYYDAGRPVKRLAVMGGSVGDCVERAASLGCDTYLTSDIKYHQWLLAKELGINLIDGDHFCTENPVIPVLYERLSKLYPQIEFLISEKHGQTVCFC